MLKTIIKACHSEENYDNTLDLPTKRNNNKKNDGNKNKRMLTLGPDGPKARFTRADFIRAKTSAHQMEVQIDQVSMYEVRISHPPKAGWNKAQHKCVRCLSYVSIYGVAHKPPLDTQQTVCCCY